MISKRTDCSTSQWSLSHWLMYSSCGFSSWCTMNAITFSRMAPVTDGKGKGIVVSSNSRKKKINGYHKDVRYAVSPFLFPPSLLSPFLPSSPSPLLCPLSYLLALGSPSWQYEEEWQRWPRQSSVVAVMVHPWLFSVFEESISNIYTYTYIYKVIYS